MIRAFATTAGERGDDPLSQREVYVSIDIESDGPCPLLNSMLSLGAAAFLDDGSLLPGPFSANLELWPSAKPDAETMGWWKTQPTAWTACRADAQTPTLVMTQFDRWLTRLPGKPIAVCYPAGYDYTFVKVYFHATLGRCPLGFQAIDLKTFAMAVLGTSFRNTTKRTMPREWFGPEKHTHVAVDDAIEQGRLFFAMRKTALSVMR